MTFYTRNAGTVDKAKKGLLLVNAMIAVEYNEGRHKLAFTDTLLEEQAHYLRTLKAFEIPSAPK